MWFHAVECTPSHSNMDCVWRATHVAPKVQNSLLLSTAHVIFSVADPDPDIFGPPGSGSIYQRYGSGSFYHQAKIVRKTLLPTAL